MFNNSFTQEVHQLNKTTQMREDETCSSLIETIDVLAGELAHNENFLALHDKTKQLHAAEIFKNNALASLKGMMLAKSHEEFSHYQNALNNVLNSFPLSSEATNFSQIAAETCLNTFEQILLATNNGWENLSSQDRQKIFLTNTQWNTIDRLIARAEKNKQQELLALKLELLEFTELEDIQVSIAKRQALLHAIHSDPDYQPADKSYSKTMLSIAKKNVANLAETRTTYLPKLTDYSRYAKNFGWVMLGVGLTVVGIVFPPLSIVGIALGVGTAVYGLVDFAKESSEPLMKKLLPQMGERNFSQFSQPVQRLLGEEKSPHVANESQSIFPEAKTLRKAAALSASGLGAAIGVVGAIALLPTVAFPPAIPFVLLGLALAASVVGIGLMIRKVYKERSKIAAAQKNAVALAQSSKDAIAGKDNKLGNDEQDTNNEQNQHLETTALMEKKMLGVAANQKLSSQQIHQVEKNSNDEDNMKVEPLVNVVSEKELTALNREGLYHSAEKNVTAESNEKAAAIDIEKLSASDTEEEEKPHGP